MAFNFSGGERSRAGNVTGQQVSSGNRIAIHRNTGQMVAPTNHSGVTAAAKIAMQFVEQKNKQLQMEKDQREILQGMSMAAQGQAIDEIAQKDSWQNKIFGKTNLVDGAKAYYSANAGNKILQDIQDHMPDLARVSPEEARAKIQERVAFGSNTGDAMTDYQVQQQVLQRLPGIFKTQAKLNYEYRQQTISDAQRQAFSSSIDVSGQNLQQMATDPNTSATDIAASVQSLREALLPVEGQDREAWEKNVHAMLLSQAQMAGRPRRVTGEDGTIVEIPGSLWNLEAIRASGVIDALPHDKVDDVLRAFERAEGAMKKNVASNYSDRMATLQAMVVNPATGKAGKDVANYIDAMNRDYQKETGSQTPLIDSEQRAAYIGRNLNAITRLNEREEDRRERFRLKQIEHAMRRKEAGLAAKLAEDARIAKENAEQAFVSLNRFQAGRIAARDPSKNKTIQKVMDAEIDSAPDSVSKLQKLASWDVIHKGTQYDVQSTVKQLTSNPDFVGKNPDAAMQVLQNFEAMRNMIGPEKTSEYYGDQYKVLERFGAAMKSTGSPGAAWQTATSDLNRRYGRNGDADKAADEIIDEQKGSRWAELIGMSGSPVASDISGTSRAALRSALATEYEAAIEQTGSPEVARARAWNAINKPDGPVMTMGSLVIPAPPKGQMRIDAWLSSSRARGDNKPSIPPEDLKDAIQDAVTANLLGKSGKKAAIDQSKNWLFDNDASNTIINQVVLDGQPHLVVTAQPEDGGHEVVVHIPATEIMDHYNRTTRKKGFFTRAADAIGKGAEKAIQDANR